ncbi:MAG: rhomboid family intramembrane serine protease [Deltaproteobacteria bacterium]|nr:rhomboid family intramembrane serine protease [Deltaproteobacteria bacterium]
MYGRGGAQLSFGPPQTPEIVKNLMIANGVVFILQILTLNSAFNVTAFGVVQPAAVWQDFQLWRVFTYMWLHSPSSFLHIAFNMFALWMFGSSLALLWGEKRFLRYYLTCGVGAGFLIASIPVILGWLGMADARDYFGQTLGASGAVMGVLLAYSFTWPDRTIMLLFPPIPIKAIYLIPLIFLMEWMSSGGAGDNVSHIGHLAGVIVGWIYLVNEGRTPGAPTPQTLLLKWRRYRMRQKIRAVHREDKRSRDQWPNDDDDSTRRFH